MVRLRRNFVPSGSVSTAACKRLFSLGCGPHTDICCAASDWRSAVDAAHIYGILVIVGAALQLGQCFASAVCGDEESPGQCAKEIEALQTLGSVATLVCIIRFLVLFGDINEPMPAGCAGTADFEELRDIKDLIVIMFVISIVLPCAICCSVPLVVCAVASWTAWREREQGQRQDFDVQRRERLERELAEVRDQQMQLARP